MIDLHSHTTASDGSLVPAQLVERAAAIGLEALAITDHDTFSGHDEAVPLAASVGMDLVCGIEISTKFSGRTVHLLGYFLSRDPGKIFREWITGLGDSRAARNQRLLEKLAESGVFLSAEDLEQKHHRILGRPHIAAAMLKKGYVGSIQQAFDEYLDESAGCYVDREEPTMAEALEQVGQAGGITSLAHPCRVSRKPPELAACLRAMRAIGLTAVEAYHSDHSPADVALYLGLAQELGLAVTGGSDFHGANKPGINLGTGRSGNLCVPPAVLQSLRRLKN